MSIEDTIKNFISRFSKSREQTGNPESYMITVDSQGSHCSQQYLSSKKMLAELIKIHGSVVKGYKLEEIFSDGIHVLDFEDLKKIEVLEAFIKGMEKEHMIKQGVVPPHYTEQTSCIHCGLVWIFKCGMRKVFGCPWCDNKRQGLPIPRPSV